MNTGELSDTARLLVAGDKGLLAMDESTPTCNARLLPWGFLRPRKPDAPIGS